LWQPQADPAEYDGAWATSSASSIAFSSGIVTTTGSSGGDPEVTTLDGYSYTLPTDNRTYRVLDTGGPASRRIVINCSTIVEGDASYHDTLRAECDGKVVIWMYRDPLGPPVLVTGKEYIKILKDGHITLRFDNTVAGTMRLSSTYARGFTMSLTERPHTLSGYVVCDAGEDHVVRSLTDFKRTRHCGNRK